MRIRSLDALRGIAAVAVVIHHWVFTFLYPAPVHGYSLQIVKRLLLQLVTLGPAAVLIFFVLSGFVLTLSLDGEGYGQFTSKRILRIYPPFAIAIILATTLWLWLNPAPVPQASVWFNGFWVGRPTATLLAAHLAMIGSPKFEAIDSVMWSLVHEMRISLVFPLIVLSLRKWFWPSLGSSLAVSICARLAADRVSPLPADVLMTVYYSFLFFAGAAMALKASSIKAWFDLQSNTVAGVLWVFAILLMLVPSSAVGGRVTVYTIGLGAILAVGLTFAHSVSTNTLETRVTRYLGKISYSLYLIHWPVLLVIVHLGAGRAPIPLIVGVGTIVMFAAAHLMNTFVERPFQRLGRRLFAEPIHVNA